MHVLAKDGQEEHVSVVDTLPTRITENGMLAIPAVNKHACEPRMLMMNANLCPTCKEYRVITVNGESTDSFNDVDAEQVTLTEGEWLPLTEEMSVELQAHSVNVIQIRCS